MSLGWPFQTESNLHLIIHKKINNRKNTDDQVEDENDNASENDKYGYVSEIFVTY